MTYPQFTLDEDQFLAEVDALIAQGDDPSISAESPGRSIESILDIMREHGIGGADGFDIGIYPLIYESDADGVLLVVYRPDGLPSLATPGYDWDDYAPRDSYGGDLTRDEAIEIARTIQTFANDLLRKEYEAS